MFKYLTSSEAYLGVLTQVLNEYDYASSPRGMKCYEILDFQYRVTHPEVGPIVTLDTERNKIIAEYTQKELEWYISGDTRASSAPSKVWTKLANINGQIHSNYGYLILHDYSEGNHELDPGGTMRTPYQWAVECLKKDKDSRQAIMRVNKPNVVYDGNKDFVCTLSVMVTIRNDRLNFSVVQRSCDARTGLVYDLPWWIWLQHHMLNDLKSTYPALTVGHTTHTIHSMHIYEKDVESIKKMIGET